MNIEKGVPIPHKGDVLRGNKYDFLKSMDIGDSVALDYEAHYKLIRHVHTYAKRIQVKVVTRKVKDEGVVRIWRVA